MKNKLGYIYINFDENSTIEINKWSLVLDKNDLAYSKIGGKMLGGNLTKDLHLTLFFGIDDNKVNKVELNKFINSLNLKYIKILKLNTFYLKEYDCFSLGRS